MYIIMDDICLETC